jgi:hypothetical protein
MCSAWARLTRAILIRLILRTESQTTDTRLSCHSTDRIVDVQGSPGAIGRAIKVGARLGLQCLD